MHSICICNFWSHFPPGVSLCSVPLLWQQMLNINVFTIVRCLPPFDIMKFCVCMSDAHHIALGQYNNEHHPPSLGSIRQNVFTGVFQCTWDLLITICVMWTQLMSCAVVLCVFGLWSCTQSLYPDTRPTFVRPTMREIETRISHGYWHSECSIIFGEIGLYAVVLRMANIINAYHWKYRKRDTKCNFW